MKYDGSLSELKNVLPNAGNILIALPAKADIDKFASGLALYLSLVQAGKQVAIVSEDTVKVAQSHLFGVDKITSNLPATSNNNFIISLEGVANPDGTIPSLEKLDWYPEGSNLNLVFHVLPGQTFKPTNVIPKSPDQQSGYDLIFTIGATGLISLGNLYANNTDIFSKAHIVNIDNQTNTNFGKTNITDPGASSISEIMTDLIPSLNLPLNSDIASNLLTGIFEATSRLTSEKVGADTYLAVSQNLKAGGSKPTETAPTPGLDLSGLIPQPKTGLPLDEKATVTPPAPTPTDFTVPPVIPSSPINNNFSAKTPSPEDNNPEPGWLTPKVFKGTSLG